MKKKIGQSLKKCCALALAVLLMFNASSLQAFAEVLAVSDSAEAVAEQEEASDDIELIEAVEGTEEVEATEVIETTEIIETTVSEEMQADAAEMVETDGTSETTKNEEISVASENVEATKVMEISMLSEAAELNATDSGITELQNSNEEKIVTLLEVKEVKGNVTNTEVSDDGRENPYELKIEASITLSVCFQDKDGNTVTRSEMSEGQVQCAKTAIKGYLEKLNVDAYAQKDNNQYSLLGSQEHTDVLNLFMRQYLLTAKTEEEKDSKRVEAETSLKERVETLINNGQCQIDLVGNTAISAGNYKFGIVVTSDDDNIAITKGTTDTQAATYQTLTQEINPFKQKKMYVGRTYVQSVTGNNANITNREVKCIPCDTEGNEVGTDIVEIHINQDTKEVAILPKTAGTYILKYKLVSNTSYAESEVQTQTLVAEVQPDWPLEVDLDKDVVKIGETAYCTISTEKLNISKQSLTWNVFEKKDGEYVTVTQADYIEIWENEEHDGENGTSRGVKILPQAAKEYKIEFTLSGDETHKETKAEVLLTAEKFEWQRKIVQPQSEMTALKEYTYSFEADNEDISELNLNITIKEVDADGNYVEVASERVGRSVEKGTDKNVIVKITPYVSGEFVLCYTYPETEKYNEKSDSLPFCVGKADFPGRIDVTSTDKKEAANGITYTIKTSEADISTFDLVCKAYKGSGENWTESSSEIVEISDVVDNTDNKVVTITPKEAGNFKFEFILTGNETYCDKSKTENERIHHTDSPATVERKTEEEVVATGSTCYQLVNNGALQSQEIVACEAMIQTGESSYRELDNNEFEYEINEAKNEVIVTPKIAGVISLKFTLKGNAVYRQKECSATLEVVKLAQPSAITVEQRCEEGKEGTAIAGEKVTYEIKDAAEPECDITKRQLVWTIRDAEGNVLCTNAAGVSAAAGRPQFQVEETTRESTTKRTVDVIPGVSGEYTIEFKLVENATYTEVVAQTALSVSKAEFSGTITPIGTYTKTNPLKIYVNVQGDNAELFQSCYEEMELVFYASYEENGETKKVELIPSHEENAENGWKPASQDNEEQSNVVTYVRTVDSSVTEKFQQDEYYTIEAEFVSEDNYAYQLEGGADTITCEAFKAINGTLDVILKVSGVVLGETYSLEYKEDGFDTINIEAREVISADGLGDNLLVENSRVGYTLEGNYSHLLELKQDGPSRIDVRALEDVRGSVELTFFADDICTIGCENDKCECGIYNRAEKMLIINITSPKTTGYTMKYQDNSYNTPEELYPKAAKVSSNGKTDHWFSDVVTVKAESDFYNYVAYIEMDEMLDKKELDVSPDWNFVKGSWTISKQEVKNYAFYFFHLPEGETIENMTSAQIRGKYFNTREADDDYKSLKTVGIDTVAPAIENELFTKVAPSEYSADNEKYFPQAVSLFAYASDGTGKVDSSTTNCMDAQSGIAKVEYKEPEKENEWTVVSSEADMKILRYASSYEYTTSQTGGNVVLRFTDYAGNTTTISYCGTYLEAGNEYTSKANPKAVGLCVDTKHPVVSVAKIYVEGNDKYSEEDWTNQPITYVLNTISKDENQPSGIQQYEYIFVERGTKFEPEKVKWNKVGKNKKSGKYEVTIGDVLESNAETRDGKFNYTGKDLNNETSYDASKCLNGYLYVRAVSKAGLYSTTDSINNNKRETHIWQNDLGVQDVKASIKPAGTDWYNAKTGGVKISFTYPTYQEKHYAPPVGLEIKVTTETANEYGETKKVTVEESVYYKGIFDENAGEPKVIEGKATVNENKNSIKVNTKKSLADTASFVVSEDCIKTIEVTMVDAAGNKSDTCTYVVKSDFKAPSIEDVVFTAGGQEMKLTKNNEGLNTKLTDSIAYNFFAGSDVTVKANAIYGVSGSGEMTLQQCKNIGDWEKKNSKNQNDNNVITSDTMTLQPNTRGFVYVTAKDAAGNSTSVWTDGFVTDNQAPTGTDGMELTVLATGANEEEFFNKDIPISISVTDSQTGDDYSGLSKVTYSVGYEDTTTKNNEEIYYFSIENPTWQDIVKTLGVATNEVVINAKENESNEAFITVDAVDKSGNESTITMEYKIDVTAPIIEVDFDKEPGEHGTYFNEDRVATIQITEKNFDASRVKITVMKDGKEVETLTPGEAAWTESKEDYVNTTSITFSEDGDYSFTVECTDKADNEAEIVEVEEFTIDKTAPEVSIAYDNEEPWKENYYNTVRTATVTVIEHNFDADKFVANISPAVSVGSFRTQEDTHTATIQFTEDEHYELTLSCEDMAGNVMDEFEAQEFYIDTTAPEITISGVEDLSANAGDIAPVISATDKNYDAEGMVITLTDSKGKKVALEQAVSVNAESGSYTLTNVNGQPDEIYTLKAEMTDLAGNTSELAYRFSLNRNGSTYDLSDMAVLVENVYTQYGEMDDLQILEMNVDTIEDFSVYVSKNGELQTNSVEGARPITLEENTVYYGIDMEGDAESGYRYYYTLYKENFEDEAVYNIMFYSKDRAGNEVNNTLTEKGAEITFVVDNSAPKVVIDGIETDTFYAEDSKEVNVAVSDNFKLKDASFYLVDEDGKTVETYNYMELAEEAGEVVTINLPNGEKKMSLTYSAEDAAGNAVSTHSSDEAVPTGFMITTNAWLQFINNEAAVAVAVAVGGSAVAIPAGGRILYRRRKIGAKLWKHK